MTGKPTLTHRPTQINGGVVPASTLRIGMPSVKPPATPAPSKK